jgi:hypothetical protein
MFSLLFWGFAEQRSSMRRRTALGALALATASVHCGAEALDPASPDPGVRGDALASEDRGCAQRGPVEVPAKPIDERRLGEEFRRRNGAAWSVTVDSLGWSATRAADAGSMSPPPRIDEASAQAEALAFVKKNADLLDLSPAELHALAIQFDPYLRRVDLSARGIPRAGYEAFPSVAKRFLIHVGIQADGHVGSLWSRWQDVPPFKLCTEPLLTPTNPRLHAEVLGHALSYYDFGGNLRSAGTVEAGDIRSTSLDIFSRRSSNNMVRLTLVYAVHVERQGLPWIFFVDADTGHLLEVVQDFET